MSCVLCGVCVLCDCVLFVFLLLSVCVCVWCRFLCVWCVFMVYMCLVCVIVFIYGLSVRRGVSVGVGFGFDVCV